MEKLKQLLFKYREVLMYLLFGVLTTLVNVLVYYGATLLLWSTTASTVLAWVLSVLFAYITNKLFVFKSGRRGFASVLAECAAFFLGRLATGVLDLAIMLVFVDVLEINGLFIKIVSNIVVIAANYVISKLLVFRRSKRENTLDNK